MLLCSFRLVTTTTTIVRIYILSFSHRPSPNHTPSQLRCRCAHKMLGAAMLGTSPKHLAALMFCAISIFSFFFFFHTPTSWGSSFTNSISKPSSPWSSTALAIQDTKDLADQHDIFDSTLEGGARIRQACMLFGSDDTAHQMGANVVYERSVRTHLKHGEKWGYPSHILRQDIIGHGKWEVLVRSPYKILHIPCAL